MTVAPDRPDESIGVPLVSVVIPVYNGELFLADAIQSVLDQSWPAVECIVVDDGSTDRTPEIAASFGDAVRLLHQPNAGVASARNVGVEATRGQYVAFLDADDLWDPDKLRQQVDALERHPDASFAYCAYRFVDGDGRARAEVHPTPLRHRLRQMIQIEGFGFGFSFTAVVPRRALDAAGPFDEQLSTSADAEYVWRLCTVGGVVAVPAVLASYRQHRGQMHDDLDAFAHDVPLIFDRCFPRDAAGARRRRRAEANLHVHLASRLLLRRDLRGALEHAVVAARQRPDRLVAAPAGAARRHLVLSVLRRWPWRRRRAPWFDDLRAGSD